MHRHIGAGLGELAVDPADVAFHRGAQVAVLPHIVAAGHGNLHERELLRRSACRSSSISTASSRSTMPLV
jgi:hypothetical protein